ncbi:hypothetical protein HQ865_07605 [Mucilaginibacter mali]|uniref:Uncharacterized protein n=1 Tax=Mucilaginibacter mali TaxID=2740462 RepID=A0A7D4UJU7_9SPHI|nr:hypothetical protein [Mucilaginibacter mali]QKJ29622.1 hypothetical protein HQ865_07605 [Mucilaginibacter mali]
MTTYYKEYVIEVVHDQRYTFGSADNINNYKFQYDASGTWYGSQHGIRINKDDTELSSAIVACTAGATTIHKHSFLIGDENIFICCANHVFALKIPELTLSWQLKADSATCFAIYPFKNDMLVHGELEISRIDFNGNIKWQFGARDIFATPDGESSFEIMDDRIYLKDFEHNIYILDENGIETNL